MTSDGYDEPVCYLPAEKGFFIVGKYDDDKSKYWKIPIVAWAIFRVEGKSWAEAISIETPVSGITYIQDPTGQITEPETRFFDGPAEWLQSSI